MVNIIFFSKYYNFIFIQIKGHVGKQNIPVVCVVVEGGTNTIRTVLEYVTEEPPVNLFI
jgi:transient receptor potential cation channel subfamily M protein 3